MRSFAIVLVCYNRISGLRRLTSSLLHADYGTRNDVDIIFSIDNSGSDIVESFAKEFIWPYGKKRIRTFNKRQGLKEHILQCGDYTKEYDIIAVLEDDLMVSDSFYHYAYQAADFYWNDDNVAGISLYTFQKNWLKWHLRFEPMQNEYDSFFMRIAMSWGQIWTTNKWKSFKEWYDKHLVFDKSDTIPEYLNEWPDSSWLKYHTRYCIEKDKFFIYPYVSLTTNFSDAGTHANRTTNDHQVELQFAKKHFSFPELSETAVRYDEYMDRIGLSEYLGINENDLTVDFFCTKRHQLYKRYLLTACNKDYKICRQYSLSLRPIEASVILGIEGSGLYLYDTLINQKNKFSFNAKYELELYNLRSREFIVFLPLVLKMSILEILNILKKRLRRLLYAK